MPAPKVRWFVTVLIAMVILGVTAGLALSRARDADAGTRQQADPAGSTPAGSVTAPDEPVPGESMPGGPAPASMEPPVDADPGPSTRPASVTGTAHADPVIAVFRVSRKPICPSGTDQVQNEGRPVVLEWRVTGAKSVTLSVDGPGVYNTYVAEDTATIDFPCGEDAGNEQTHTYTIAVTGPEGTESKTLTVTAPVDGYATT
ncbi:MAG TPA: hypothetical protein VN408_07920 [Actinoplanes sp.]|nr:hypothetical protein [Actinoplanes sp.]